MPKAPRTNDNFLRGLLWLFLKFVILAPVCLVLWLLALPAYAQCLAYVSEIFLRYAMQYPITDLAAAGGGFLNTDTTITFVTGATRRVMPNVGLLTTNLAPFVALVLATSGLAVRRRLKVLGIGVPIILLSHVVTVIVTFSTTKSPLPTAIGFISITLPFLLWIVLAYRDKVAAFLQDTSN